MNSLGASGLFGRRGNPGWGAEPAAQGSPWPPQAAGAVQVSSPVSSSGGLPPRGSLFQSRRETGAEEAGSLPAGRAKAAGTQPGGRPGPALPCGHAWETCTCVPKADNTCPLRWERRGGKVALQEPFERA